MYHSWELKKLDPSYSETTHLLGLRLWLQGVLMSALCCRSFRSNRCLVSEYEMSNFLGSQDTANRLYTVTAFYTAFSGEVRLLNKDPTRNCVYGSMNFTNT